MSGQELDSSKKSELAPKLKVFVSYSRAQVDFADELALALEDKGYEILIDRHGISKGEPFEKRLEAMILACDMIVSILTDEYATSPACQWEVQVGAQLNKRFLVVTPHKPSDNIVLPQQLSEIDWIHCWRNPKVPGTSLTKGFIELDEALTIDLSWLRQQTELQEQAMRWAASGHVSDSPILLVEGLLEDAQTWARAKPRTHDILDEVAEFISASEQAEAQRKAAAEANIVEREAALQRAKEAIENEKLAERNKKKAIRIGLFSSFALTAVASVTAIFAYMSANHARAARDAERILNQRLSLPMELSVSITAGDRVHISERWYQLATQNAASVLVYRGVRHGTQLDIGSGFLVRGSDLNPNWTDEILIVIAEIVAIDRTPNDYVSIPAIAEGARIELGETVWSSGDFNYASCVRLDYVCNFPFDVTVIRPGSPIPGTAVPVRISSDYDFSDWPKLSAPTDTTYPKSRPLISIGYTDLDYDLVGPGKTNLTMSIMRSTGILEQNGRTFKVFYTDASGLGSSGAPVFDANTGELVALEQVGLDGWAGGAAVNAIKLAIQETNSSAPANKPSR